MVTLEFVRNIAGSASPRAGRILLLLALLFCIAPAPARAAVDVPLRPENYLLDQGDIFPPDVEQRIVSTLQTAAHDYDVHIYVMTLPTLQVMPSRVAEKLNELLSATRTEWLKGRVGAVIIFDDEAGRAAIGDSDEARKVFSPVALNMLLKDPKLQSKKKRSGPEKLASTVSLVVKGFTDLRTESNAAARKRSLVTGIFASIITAAIVAGGVVFALKRRAQKMAATNKHRRTPAHA